MAEDSIGQRQETKVPWTKIFTAFKVALDIRKLLLAAAGILAMNLGWVLLSWVFFNTRTLPQADKYLEGVTDAKEKESRFTDFQVARKRWNLLNKLAGKESLRIDAGDIAANYKEFQEIQAINQSLSLGRETFTIEEKDQAYQIRFKGLSPFTVSPLGDPKVTTALDKLRKTAQRIIDIERMDEANQTIVIAGQTIKIDNRGGFDAIKLYIKDATSEGKLDREIEVLEDAAKKQEDAGKKQEELQKIQALKRYKASILILNRYKPNGQLSSWVWAEDRGPNPYLLVSGVFKHEGPDGQRSVPWAKGQFFGWLLSDQLPVLVEPLFKVLSPLVYLFDADAGGFGNRLYLLLMLFWTLFVWGFFGGAITRMAVVQIARNEKISLREAIAFARERWVSYFSAPVFPLVLLAILTFVLIIFGIIEGHTYFLGDILAVLIWPIALLLGMIMAVVLVGLIGWPLMNATISAEGSDAFDALSRSYSYVYQAPWQYLWFSFLALVYGAVLVFFIGLMGSLMVFMGKWGLSQAPYLSSASEKRDREPTYLFLHAPKSFGWRDLLIHDSRFAQSTQTVSSGGLVHYSYEMKKDYLEALSWHNKLGSWLVTLWLGLLFLLIVGFGYSYFWTASTIIYLLMRKVVDDTEIDEIHVEEDMQQPFPQEPATPAPAPEPKPGTVGLSMVEPPALRPSPDPAPAAQLVPTPEPPKAPEPPMAPEPPKAEPPSSAGDGAPGPAQP